MWVVGYSGSQEGLGLGTWVCEIRNTKHRALVWFLSWHGEVMNWWNIELKILLFCDTCICLQSGKRIPLPLREGVLSPYPCCLLSARKQVSCCIAESGQLNSDLNTVYIGIFQHRKQFSKSPVRRRVVKWVHTGIIMFEFPRAVLISACCSCILILFIWLQSPFTLTRALICLIHYTVTIITIKLKHIK